MRSIHASFTKRRSTVERMREARLLSGSPAWQSQLRLSTQAASPAMRCISSSPNLIDST